MIRTPCREFTGWRNPRGYDRQSHNNRSVANHRLAYCQAHGLELSDIAGQVVRHTCDNPPCINPDHLVLGTQQDNINDMVERGRKVTARGHSLPHTTPADVERQVRDMLAKGMTHRAISAALGVGTGTVSRIRNGDVR